MKYYKILSADLKSMHGGNFDWSDYLPDGENPGKWTPEIEPVLCESGWHVTPYPCMWIRRDSDRVFEVETAGDPVHQCIGAIEKVCFRSVRLVRDVTSDHVPDRNSNSGCSNSGDMNSGDCNSGDRNSGDYNSGNYNSGISNSGHWNACDGESGFLNTEQPCTIRVFNRICPRSEWECADIPGWFYFELDPEVGYKASWQKAYEAASEEEREKVKRLPNFDADVFYELSGIDLRSGE
jgi:hypothetical protein